MSRCGMSRWRFLPLCMALYGCGYSGSARLWDPGGASVDFKMVANLKPVLSSTSQSCGPSAFAMVDRFYSPGSENGPKGPGLVPAIALRNLARDRGYRAHIVRGEFRDIVQETRKGRPMIVGLLKPHRDGARPHYEVVGGIDETRRVIATIDPARGWTINSYEGFLAEWEPTGRVLLIMAPALPDTALAMGDEEDAQLSIRAAMNEELQHFAGGYVMLAVFAAEAAVVGAVLALFVTVGNVVALPLGISHSSRGRGFIPGDSWDPPNQGEMWVNRSAFIFGFPVYGLGYLMGLPCATPEIPTDTGPLWVRLGIAVEDLPLQERLALASPGEIVIVFATGPALEAGLQEGDVITEIGGLIVTAGNVAEVLPKAMREELVSITVLRDGIERGVKIRR